MVRGGRGLLALKRQLPAKCGFPSIHVCSRPLLSDSSNIRPCYVAETFGGALAKFQCRGSVYIGGCMYHFILICLWSSGYMIAWGRVRCVEVTNIFILPISLFSNVPYWGFLMEIWRNSRFCAMAWILLGGVCVLFYLFTRDAARLWDGVFFVKTDIFLLWMHAISCVWDIFLLQFILITDQ